MTLSFFRGTFLTVFILASALFCAAQGAPRTWVSSAGDDNNPCNPIAPCKSFAGALTKTAVSGEINCLGPGGYGPVTISVSVTIDCTGTFGGITVASGSAITINASSSGVVKLRGLSINGLGTAANGISIGTGIKVSIENTVIDGFISNGISMTTTNATSLMISNSSIRNNNGDGVHITPGSVTPSVGSIVNTQIIGNGVNGLNIQGSDIAVSNCMISRNGTGILATQNGTVRISGNTVSENSIGLTPATKGFIVSYGNNAVSGNASNGSVTSVVALM